MRLHEGGQIFSLDLILASMIFLALLLSYAAFIYNYDARILREKSQEELSLAAENAANSLVSSGGLPESWAGIKFEDVNSIGLASSFGVISQKKISKLSDLNSAYYSEAKDLMGLSKYGAYISLSDFNSGVLYEFGNRPVPDSMVGVSERIVVFNGDFAVLRLEAYK